MRVLVTSGPTREPIDDVRYVSNLSTGALGTAVATAFATAGHDVLLLHGAGSLVPRPMKGLETIQFGSALSLLDALVRAASTAPVPDLLIHAAAVADYAPEPQRGKIKSSEPELVLRMTPTPKVVDRLREAVPSLPVIVFKLEAGISREELHARARATMRRVGAVAVVANLLAEVGPARHRADLLRADETVVEWEGRAAIARGLVVEAAGILAAGKERS